MTLLNKLFKNVSIVSGAVLLVGALAAPMVNAQSSMSPEELKDFIKQQQAELDRAIENRDATLEELEKMRKRVAEQAERQAEIEQKMAQLCAAQEAIKPGTLQSCMAGK